MKNYPSPKSPPTPLLLFILKISPLIASSYLGKMPALSARKILLTFSLSNSIFSHYLFSHYLSYYSISHGLQRLPCQSFVILPRGLWHMLQDGAELVPDAFRDLLSHVPSHLLLPPLLVCVINPSHTGLILIELFYHQTGHWEVWDSVIGAAGGSVAEDFGPGTFDRLPHPLLVICLHPLPHILNILLMPIHGISLEEFFHEFLPLDGRPTI